MAIWKTPFTLDQLNEMNRNTMVEHLGISFVDFDAESMTATMPVDSRTLQPFGIMHGGASASLAETVGSIAANFSVNQEIEYCVGLDINTSHLKKVSEGMVKGIARPVHIGRKTHVWEVKIFNNNDQLISQSRLTMFVIKK